MAVASPWGGSLQPLPRQRHLQWPCLPIVERWHRGRKWYASPVESLQLLLLRARMGAAPH